MGRPRFRVTDEHRYQVRSMAAYGLRQEEIAKMIHLKSQKTLRRHFAEELALGAIEALTQVAQTCYKMATSGKHPEMTRFWLSRNGWPNRGAAEGGSPPFIVALEPGKRS